MTIDPRYSIILACVISLLGYVVGIGSLLADAGVDPAFTKHLLAWCSIISGALANILAVLTGIPSKDNQTGFIIKGPPPKQP